MSPVAAQTWLILRNDLRLLWRGMLTGRKQVFTNGLLLLVIAAFFQGLALLAFLATDSGPPRVVETLVWLFFAFVMFGAAMNHAIGLLFDRADFDLLLASPVSARAILLARWAALTVGAAVTVLLFVVPLLNAAAICRTPRYLAGYVVWLLVAGLAASVGVWATLVLVRWLGARRARTWGQVFAGLLGTSVYLVFQGQNFLPPETRVAFARKVLPLLNHPVLAFPARAARGDPLALLGLAAATVLSAGITLRLLSRLFVSGVQEAAGVKPQTRRVGRHDFVDGLYRATFWKDVRLIIRDPLLLSKILPSVLYLLPMAFAVGRLDRTGAATILAPFGALVALFLAPQLTAIATSGEEGWDMIRMSGASTIQLRIAKIAAGMALPLSLCAAVAVAVSALGRPGLGVLVLGIALTGSAAACWLEVVTIRPTPRRDLIQNRRLGRTMSAGKSIVTGLVFISTAAAASLAAYRQWALAAVACGVVALLAIACFTLAKPRDPEFEGA